MRYKVNVEPDTSGFLVTFPDIPEALTSGSTIEEAMVMASDALRTALEFYFEDKRVVPSPSKIKVGDKFIELPLSLSAKVRLLNELVSQEIRPAELARRMDVRPQEVNRLIDLHHATKIDSIQAAMKAVGKELDFVVT